MASSHPVPNTQLDEAWNLCVHSNRIDERVVRGIVAQSWQRCKEYRLDPFISSGQKYFPEEVLQRRRVRRADLLSIASPLMQVLGNLCGKGFIILLCDDEGCILETAGDPEIMGRAEESHIGRGANLREDVLGTNSMGLVLVEKRPVEVFAQEHFCRLFHEWTCSAAPIFDPRGDLLGILDISGESRRVHPHTLGMVVAAARAIENEVKLHSTYNMLDESNQYTKAIMELTDEGVIVVDRDRIIRWVNRTAARYMDIEPRERIGDSLHGLGAFAKPLLAAIGDNYPERETVMENTRSGVQFSASARSISLNSEIHGSVILLKEIAAVPRAAARMVGARAHFTFADLIGSSGVFRKAVDLARRASLGASTVLLEGETGTGKELFAQAIHNESSRSGGPFVAVNCAAIPRELIISELFGYDEGAFTGAKRGGSPGKFELAGGGTIFLDEIGDMPADVQVALLRVLQERHIVRLGGRRVIPVDVRVVVASNRHLELEVFRGTFRQDLFHRLNVVNVRIPALRERRQDVPLLVHHFLNNIEHQFGKSVLTITDEAMALLVNYSWPGNVRELENALERAANIISKDVIDVEDIPEIIHELPFANDVHQDQATPMKDLELRAIVDTLQKTNGNVARAAKELGISRNTIYNRLRRMK